MKTLVSGIGAMGDRLLQMIVPNAKAYAESPIWVGCCDWKVSEFCTVNDPHCWCARDYSGRCG